MWLCCVSKKLRTLRAARLLFSCATAEATAQIPKKIP